jgi:hypothetical protein
MLHVYRMFHDNITTLQLFEAEDHVLMLMAYILNVSNKNRLTPFLY